MPGLLSGNFQSQHVKAVEMLQTTILSETYQFKSL